MAATAKDVRTADVADEFRKWWDTFNSGITVNEQDDEEEAGVDSDSDFEQVAEEEQNVGVAANAGDGKITAAAHARVEEQGEDGGAARNGDDEEVSEDGNVQTRGVFLLGRKRKTIVTGSKLETTGTEIHDKEGQDEEVSEDVNVQIQGVFLGRKRKTIATGSKPETTGIDIHDKNEERISDDNYVSFGDGLRGTNRVANVTPGKLQMTTGTEIQNNKDQGECLRAENEMLRLQLVRKTKELEDEHILRLELELRLKNKEIKSLKKQNEKLRDDNEHCRKTAKPSKNPRLCRFCKEYVLGHDYRNCPKRNASSEQDEADDSS